MNRWKYSLISLSVVLIMVTGCKKDSNDDNVLTTKMTATINGNTWNSTARYTNKSSSGFIITGTNVSTTLVASSLVVKINGTSTGTYKVSVAGSNTCYATYTPDGSDATNSYVSISGTVELTEVNTSDKTISGTFSFTCTKLIETATITNGTFTDMKYTETTE